MKYVVVRNWWAKGKDHVVVDKVEATSMEVKQAEHTIVIFRDGVGRMIGVVSEFDSVYEESALTLGEPSLTSEEETKA